MASLLHAQKTMQQIIAYFSNASLVDFFCTLRRYLIRLVFVAAGDNICMFVTRTGKDLPGVTYCKYYLRLILSGILFSRQYKIHKFCYLHF